MFRPELPVNLELLRDARGVPGAAGEGGGRVAGQLPTERLLRLQHPRDPPVPVRPPRGGQPRAHPTAGEAHQPGPLRGRRHEAQLHPNGRRRGQERRAARRQDLQTQVGEQNRVLPLHGWRMLSCLRNRNPSNLEWLTAQGRFTHILTRSQLELAHN